MKIGLSSNATIAVDQLENDSAAIKRAMMLAMFRAMSLLEAEVKQNIRTRSGLKVRTGTLLNSIQSRIYMEDGKVKGEIGPENVPYAAIHEFGGQIPGRFVYPLRKKALRFVDKTGRVRFSKGHFIPTVKIKARPYMRPAIEATSKQIEENFGIFINDALRFRRVN